ncbi:MAG: o-succinylbenzoate synthase [Bacteroidetes bacterium]|nr:o-succinylbenzoate synthase [Bacteroidota bacterium]MBS1541753.1 o-succinylbenzoate synthase [Bacteroidota bacterium]
MLRADSHRYVLKFSFAARTSRGPMTEKTSWFVRLWDDSNPQVYGLGECGPLQGLSREYGDQFESTLLEALSTFQKNNFSLPEKQEDALAALSHFFSACAISREHSSIVFGIETALLDLMHGGKRLIFKNQFIEKIPVPINGLVWMGGLDFMLQQVEIKIREGYRCMKLKVGGLDFEKECDVLNYIRRKYFREKIEIRLDANGAFKKEDALDKINSLKRFDIHSIEQPIKPGLPEMEEICAQSPIPIALDEEMIGIHSLDQKENLLKRLKPQFIILKPTLHGGFVGCDEWIRLADNQQIGWWITSALESNIGLNAIAQFTSRYSSALHHGLGTGQIYENNFPSPLLAEKGLLHFQPEEKWDITNLFPQESGESLYIS